MNNPATHNFNVLILVLLTHLRRIRLKAYVGEWPVEAINSLFALRLITKHLVRNHSRGEIVDIFDFDRQVSSPSHHIVPSPLIVGRRRSVVSGRIMDVDDQVIVDKRPRSTVLFEELIQVIIYAETKYAFYEECFELLYCLLASQLDREPSEHYWDDLFWNLLMHQMSHFANGLTTRLLRNYIEQQPAPQQSSTGLFMSAYSLLVGRDPGSEVCRIAENSIILLVLISCQWTDDASRPFKDAIGLFETVQDTAVSPLADGRKDENHVSFKLIYDQMARSLEQEATVILLYLLLMRNNHFRIYFLSKTDPETMVLGLLKIAYEALEEKRPLAILNLVLDILVIVSQDEAYIKNAQKISVASPAWYIERTLRKVTLGGILSLIVMRILLHNLTKTHSIHIHTASIAVLCNMSCAMYEMETVVAQRLVTLLEQVSKKFFKLYDEAAQDGQPSDTLIVCSDVVALLLEVIHSIICTCLKDNPHLTYTLLERQELIQQFDEFARFAPLVDNIVLAIEYFKERIEEAHIDVPTVDALLEVIDRANQTWTPSKLTVGASDSCSQVYPSLKFHAEEDPLSYQFLIPLCWTLLFQKGHVSGQEAVFQQHGVDAPL
ncbi:hypothetical protein HDU91_001732 [Kappamyces sp. JEL0680]|nr:hypothetical protein HDU91_001732 [Kappamyces sp. JEL0680]